MREEVSDCVDCGLPCIYNSCPHYRVIVYKCDSCGVDSTTENIYSDGAYHYCAGCLIRANMNDFVKDMIDEHAEEWIKDNFQEVEG